MLFRSLELYDLRPEDLPGLLGDGKPTFVMVDATNVETQWRDQPLGETYRWLKEQGQLQPLLQLGPYTLSRLAVPFAP